jgi:hypothetical protein
MWEFKRFKYIEQEDDEFFRIFPWKNPRGDRDGQPENQPDCRPSDNLIGSPEDTADNIRNT